jgi:CRISPR-associated protein (TIGR03986 family)
MHWIINEPGNEKKHIPKDVVENYEKDEQRDERSDLFQQLKRHPQGVPCFYLENGQSIKAFGHTGIFRLPYEKSIEDHIPNKADNTLDITEAIFGDTEHIMGRVSFEDANFTGDKNQAFEATTSPKILSSPKPTTFQHYLEQPQGINTPRGQLKNWNGNAPIRGHKMYWHRKNPNWSEGKPIRDRNDTQHTIITPIKTGSTFKGTIRFENLTEVELGALLFVLELKENLCHKIGMAKPLGLGSVHISPTLKLIDRHSEQGRYATLFSDNDWHTAENQEQDQKKYTEKFEKYVLDKLGKTTNSLWETERLKELKAMLDFTKTNNANWNSKTEYLPLVEFRQRKVLPKPSEV